MRLGSIATGIFCVGVTALLFAVAGCAEWSAPGLGWTPTPPGAPAAVVARRPPPPSVVSMAPPGPCAPDAVQVGPTCVDVYEASVWQIPAENTGLIQKVQAGTATLDDLTGAGATPINPSPLCNCLPDSGINLCPAPFPGSFPPNGNWTEPLYAASVSGARPTGCVTWFQAEQACALSGKRLLTNQEWQRAAAGTPDGAPCIVDAFVGTAGTDGCVSNWYAYDMVGNVWEWVADWGDRATNCTSWDPSLGSDVSCVGGPGGTDDLSLPGAFRRGGDARSATDAGIFAIDAREPPSFSDPWTGFRCGR